MANLSRLRSFGSRLFAGWRSSNSNESRYAPIEELLLNLNCLGPNSDRMSVCFCGVSQSESASSIAVAAAKLAASTSARRILLIDLNPIGAATTSMFQLAGQPGLADAIAAPDRLADVIFETTLENLSVLPAGDQRMLNDVADSDEAFESLLKHLTADFDCVFMDAPAANAAASELTRLRYVDKVLLVLNEHSSLAAAKRAKRLLAHLGANVTGVVLGGR